jgi:hypothetical protein
VAYYKGIAEGHEYNNLQVGMSEPSPGLIFSWMINKAPLVTKSRVTIISEQEIWANEDLMISDSF